MPIKVKCQCGQAFAVKDELAGKTLKCPKCASPLKIPSRQAQQPRAQKPSAPSAQAAKPAAGGAGGLGNLLDEAGIGKHADHKGPRCPSCGVPVPPNSVICVECGFNSQTGERMQTQADVGLDAQGNLTEAEKMVRKAAEEIKDTPIGTTDYGDGAMAYVFTLGLIVATAISLGLAAFMLYLFDSIIAPAWGGAGIGFIVGLVFYVFGRIWLITIAFIENVFYGLAFLFCGEWFGIYYCFTRLDKAKIPTFFYILGMIMVFVCSMIAEPIPEDSGGLRRSNQVEVTMLSDAPGARQHAVAESSLRAANPVNLTNSGIGAMGAQRYVERYQAYPHPHSTPETSPVD